MTIYAEDCSVAEDVRAAGLGDQQGWDRLVDRFAGLVWDVARSYGADAKVAADVSQVTWLRLVDNLHSLPDPEQVGEWLADTAGHESQRVRNSIEQRRAPDAEVDRADFSATA